MLMRRDFYNRNKVYLPRDPLSRGVVPDDYHIFAADDRISICLYYQCEQNDKKVQLYYYLQQSLKFNYLFLIFLTTEYPRKT